MAELISIPLKKPSDVDVVKPLLNIIKSTYSSNQKDYSDNIVEFSKLRKNALWRAFEKYESSLEVIYRYYDQICFLEGKIPTNELQIPFKWKDAFDRTIFGGKLSLTISTLAYEKVCVLFNIAALQSSVAATQSLESDEGLKLAAKLLQQAAGIFQHLKSNIMLVIQQEPTPDMSPETLEALSYLMLAQAQEIFTLKAIHDGMKDHVVAKLAAQTEELYSETCKLFQKEIFRAFWDREWVPLISGKQLGYRGVAEYYQSLVCKANKHIGEEIARLELSVEMFKSAFARSNKLAFLQDYSNRASRNLTEVKKDNDFIYHERIPDPKNLTAIGKASVAKMLPLPDKFSSDFQDIFSDLLPISVHNAISNFEAQKGEVVNTAVTKLRNARQMLNGTLASLNLPAAIEDVGGATIPQSLLEKSSYIKEAGGIRTLEKMMNELPELLQRNKDILDEAERMLNEEQTSDDHLRSQFKERWTRLPSIRLTEQFKSTAQKYRGIINTAITADKVVREKFETHRNSVNILSMEQDSLANYLPTGSAVEENDIVSELRLLMDEVEVLKTDQDSIENELKNVSTDKDAFLSAHMKNGTIDEKALISENIQKCYGPLLAKVDQCLERQEDLLKVIKVQHEKFAREQSSYGSSREKIMCELAAAYDAFKELMSNLQEGVKFYNDLTQLLVVFQNKISDFCFARKTEKEEILKDLTSNLSKTDSSGSIEIPSHHQSGMVPQVPVPQTLPYPVQGTGHMPIPYAMAPTAAPYPTMLPPPLPTSYNPYVTLQYPMQGAWQHYPGDHQQH